MIGTIYVAKWTNNAGTAFNGMKDWGSANSWATSLDWLGKTTGWRMPTQVGSTGELPGICTSKNLLGSYQPDFHWSGTASGGSFGWYVRFSDCYIDPGGDRNMSTPTYIRAVRSGE